MHCAKVCATTPDKENEVPNPLNFQVYNNEMFRLWCVCVCIYILLCGYGLCVVIICLHCVDRILTIVFPPAFMHFVCESVRLEQCSCVRNMREIYAYEQCGSSVCVCV